jgi:elongation factor P
LLVIHAIALKPASELGGATMISSNDLRPGVTIEYRDSVWQVIEAMHVKPGKGSAFVQTKLRNMETGDVLKVTFRAGERLAAANIERIALVYLYKDGDQFVMMNAEGTDSLELAATHFGRNVDLLKEGLGDITATRHRERIIQVDLPNLVELEVHQTPPDERGDTNSGGSKEATLETGAVISVPFHIEVGDRIRIDTRSREYVARVSQ